jgi:hypothetical protein
MRFHGTSLTMVERLLAKPHIFQRQVIRLVEFHQSNEKGSWWQPQGTAIGEITPEQEAEIAELARSFFAGDNRLDIRSTGGR